MLKSSFFQVVVIAYLFVTSIVGLYSIPQFHRILPKTRCTEQSQLPDLDYFIFLGKPSHNQQVPDFRIHLKIELNSHLQGHLNDQLDPQLCSVCHPFICLASSCKGIISFC